MQIRVLGTIDVLDPADLAIGGPTQRRVLSMLSMRSNQIVSVDQLVDAVWPDGAVPERAEHNVRTYVHRLRTSLGGAGDRIETDGTGYRLLLERDELDATRFEDLVAEARTATGEADHERARRLLDEALELWGGRPYDEFADEEWARAEATRLGEVRASAIEHRFAALLDAGRHTEVVGPLQEAVSDEPWREARRVQLALALYRSGRQAEALEAIQLYRSELAEELGLEPSLELGQLEHRILEHDPALLPASHQQHMLRGYQLDEVIGEGAFSLVWRGVQPSLGRTVAVKQIRAELANQPDFVRRFETEAQTVAALEHPYIVPLYDYWREPDSAYLVMRYVPGGTLESEVLDRGLDESRLRHLVEQVGSALHTAHRAGVIHRDVKSANVLTDADDNFYLTDFGIALTGSADDDELATTLSTGSPAYASPEQLRRQGLDNRTDVYGFGITLFEAATGRLPFVDAPTKAALVKRQLEDPVPAPSSVTATVPAWVDELVARATAKNPADRFGSIDELMAAVPPDATNTFDHGRGFATSTVVGDLVNPFKALRAFREADSDDFYGRDRLVARFVDVLSRPGSAGRLLAAVGPSGSGKSSAVRSGLLPRLRTGAVSGSQDWFITTMLPGTHPFEELESALSRVAVRQPGPLVEMMRGDHRGIARAINQILPDEEDELLLVVDQFEELFTHTSDADQTRFLEGLLAAVREPRSRLRLVVTIRADFLDGPLRHPGLAARLETATITVSPLAADELEAAIVEPVRRQGAVYEPGLVARIMADVGDQPGALPLLQYALTELFDAHVSGLLQAESYEAIGGLTGALASRAEDTLSAMNAEQQSVARRVFGRLVTLGEGTDDTRRRVRRSELGDDPDTTDVIDTFGAARLLVFDHDPSTREPTVEIAHEALLTAWPRLRGWLDEDRDGLRIHRHLTETTAAWLASDRDDGELYRGGRLESATAWVANNSGDLNPAEREFFEASIATHDAELAAEQEHLDTTIRSNRRLRILVSVATVIAVIAAVAGVFAFQQRSRAEDEAVEARTQTGKALVARQEAEAARDDADDNAQDASDRAAEAEAERKRADQNAAIAEQQRDAADLQRMRSDALLLSREGGSSLALLLAVEADRIDPSLASKDVLHRALSAGSSSEIAAFDGIENSLVESLPLPDDQVAMLEDSEATLHTAVVNGGEEVLTSLQTPDRSSTVYRHTRTNDPFWETIDTGASGWVTSSGEFTVWVSDEIVVKGPDHRPLGQPIPWPEDLLSVTLSNNGEVVVLQRPGGVLDVYATTGDSIGQIEVPGASPGNEFAISLLGDGSMISAVSLFERDAPWALWGAEGLSLRASGQSSDNLDIRYAESLIADPVLSGPLLYTTPPQSNSLRPADPLTGELADDRTFLHEGRVTTITTADEFGILAAVSFNIARNGDVFGSVRVWDAGSALRLGGAIDVQLGLSVAELKANKGRYSAEFDSMGRLVVQGPDSVAIWNYDVSTWADIACHAAGRNMTRDEWEQYGPTSEEYRKTCDQYAITS